MIQIRKYSTVVFWILLLSMRWDINDYIGNNMTQLIENGMRILAALCSVFLYCGNRKRVSKMSLVFLILVLMQVWLLISTAINKGDFKTCLVGYLFPVAIIGLMAESMLHNPNDFIKGSMLFAEVLVYTNLIIVILFPDGIYSTYTQSGFWYTANNWLLGSKNLFFPYFLFACLIAFLYSEHGGRKWREKGIYIACLLNVIFTGSATSSIAITTLIILFLINKNRKIRLNVYLLVAINATLFFLIVIFRMQNIFSFLIESIMKKKLTFTGRTQLWDVVLSLNWKNPLLGYGVMKGERAVRLTGFSYGSHAHNMFLDNLYRGGIIYLALHLTVLFLVYRKLHKFQKNCEAQAISSALFVFQIAALMEPYNGFANVFIYLIYIMAYHVNRFIPQEMRNV